MPNNLKFSFVNINKDEFITELNKKGVYYANVVMWTVLFSLPLFWLLDFLFVRDLWLDLMLIRLVVAVISYTIYILGSKSKWDYIKTISLFLGINLVMHTFFCGIVPINHVLPYFLILSIVVLLMNTATFWPPVYSIFFCLLTYVIIFLLYLFHL